VQLETSCQYSVDNNATRTHRRGLRPKPRVHPPAGALINPIVEPKLLLTPLLTKEAVSSSSLEGTQATIEEVFRYEAADRELRDEELRMDAHEIINYRRAIEASVEELNKRAIGENLLKTAHSILLDSVRGSRKNPGQFRRGFVYVGNRSLGIQKASLIPPPPEELPRLIANWETYINRKNQEDSLVQIAVAHYQFEAIHPFADGNGRIGRLVIPLFLLERGLLPSPVLYISEFFEQSRETYTAELRAVDREGQWTPWITFFLEAVTKQALRTTAAIQQINTLYERLKGQVSQWGSAHALAMLDQIFIRPAVNYSSLKNVLKASHQTIYTLLDRFEQEGILVLVGALPKSRTYVFAQLIDLLK
jgi:Fic family protein